MSGQASASSGTVFDMIYEAVATSPTLRRIDREVFGDDYADEVEQFGFVSRSELRWIARELRMGGGGRFLDLGCGRGGPALWVARATEAAVTGVDLSRVALTHATARVTTFSPLTGAAFLTCDAARLALASASHDAAMSVDALQMMRDRIRVLHELARVLRPSARFVFTTWESCVDDPQSQTSMIADHRPLLDAAGFNLVDREEAPEWPARERAWCALVLAHQEAIIEEVGHAVGQDLIDEARSAPTRPPVRRIRVVAELRGVLGADHSDTTATRPASSIAAETPAVSTRTPAPPAASTDRHNTINAPTTSRSTSDPNPADTRSAAGHP